MVNGEDVLELYELLTRSGMRCWLGGGWGIDALLRRYTRPHHDIDIFLTVDDLPVARQLLRDRDFVLDKVWPENRWLAEGDHRDGADQASAFVLKDARGRELDIHVLARDPEGNLVPAWQTDREFGPDALLGEGTVCGVPIACLSAEMQIRSHAGYELPRTHREDLAHLKEHMANSQ